MKYCKDCLHHAIICPTSGDEFVDTLRSFIGANSSVSTCSREDLRDPVDGKKLYRDCRLARKRDDLCGPDAKWFQTKS